MKHRASAAFLPMLLSLLLCVCMVSALAESDAVSIIGGADGPTAIFLAASDEEPLCALIEAHIPSAEFSDMPKDIFDETIAALGGIADAYQFVGRATTDGRGYLLGVLTAPQSPLLNTAMMGVTQNGVRITCVTTFDGERTLFELPGDWLNYDFQNPTLLLVTPTAYAASDFYAVFNRLIAGEWAYLLDAKTRGVTLTPPKTSYLSVHMVRDGEYREEYIALTDE